MPQQVRLKGSLFEIPLFPGTEVSCFKADSFNLRRVYLQEYVISNQVIFMSENLRQTTQQKTERFLKMVEAGDLALYHPFEEAVCVFGFTKAGKTTTCHLMSGSSLRPENVRGEFVLKLVGQRYKDFRIGNTTDSQTQIPNTFQAVIRKPDSTKPFKISLLDQPGWGDSYGFHRIFSNGYFHYRTFSKTPKIKFVLAIKKEDLVGTGEQFKKSIRNFLNIFKNWELVKKQVLRATSILITKSDAGTKLQHLQGTINNLKGSVSDMTNNEKLKYQEVIETVLASNRLFFIQRPKNNIDSKIEDKLLQQIYDRSQFWERPMHNNVVDMSQINFSVGKEILKRLRDDERKLFHEQYQDFMKLILIRMRNVIVDDKASLANIIQTLKSDATTSMESKQVLSDMEQFNKKYYNFMDEYKLKRSEAETSLFKEEKFDLLKEEKQDLSTIVDIEKLKKHPYFIKKFKVLEFLETIGRHDISFQTTTQRSIQKLQEFSSLFISIFRMFSILRTSANDKDNTILKYSYIIQRVIEESKILTLILFQNEQIKDEIDKMSFTVPEDVFRTIQDIIITQVIGDIKTDELKEQFISSLDLDQLNCVNPQTIQFFESIINKGEQIEIKIAKSIVDYSQNLLIKDKQLSEEDLYFAGRKLYIYRNKFYAHLENLKATGASQFSIQKIIQLLFRLTNVLGGILEHLNRFEEARECYHAVHNAERVFEMFEKQIKSEAPDAQRKLLVEYAKQATFYCRRQLAIKCCQRAYSLASNFEEMKQISNLIIEITSDNSSSVGNQIYLSKFYSQDFCSDLSSDIRDNIEFALNI